MNKMVWLVVGVIVFTFSAVERSYGVVADDVNVSLTGFIQNQYESHENADDTFKLLRARPRIKASLGERVSFFVQLDLAYDRIMNDIWVELNYNDYAKLRIGQFLLPFGKQTPINPYNLLTINYSQVVSKLFGGGDLRDVGIIIHGNFSESNIAVLDMFNYSVSCVNGEGSGSGVSEQNEQKAFLGRIGVKPLNGLELGASGYSGKRGIAKIERNRIGVDFRFDWENLLIQGEYIQSTDETDATLAHTVEGGGYFVEAGYKITPLIQPMLKYDVWDPEVSGANGSLTKIAVGLNWYIDDFTRLQGMYEIKSEEENEFDNNSLLIQLGIAF
ncbi:hypothetical protein ACFL1R_09000 [Candidatus Latescibacterota bacterium]